MKWELRHTVDYISTITLARPDTKSNEETVSVNKSAEGECFYPNSLYSLILQQRVLIAPYFVDNMMRYLSPLVSLRQFHRTTESNNTVPPPTYKIYVFGPND